MKRALEKSMATLENNQGHETMTFIRLFIDSNEDEVFAAMPTSLHAIPMLFFAGEGLSSSLWQNDLLQEIRTRHLKALTILKDKGHRKAVIAADCDGLIARMLSPRFSDWSLSERMALLLSIFREGQKIIDELWVLFTVEELIPGGMDASDGVIVAQNLEQVGLKTVMVASGTKDFMPLYQRKVTKKKTHQEEEFSSGEPALASSLWVRHNTSLSVWASADLDNEEEASRIALAIGLEGIVSPQC